MSMDSIVPLKFVTFISASSRDRGYVDRLLLTRLYPKMSFLFLTL